MLQLCWANLTCSFSKWVHNLAWSIVVQGQYTCSIKPSLVAQLSMVFKQFLSIQFHWHGLGQLMVLFSGASLQCHTLGFSLQPVIKKSPDKSPMRFKHRSQSWNANILIMWIIYSNIKFRKFVWLSFLVNKSLYRI